MTDKLLLKKYYFTFGTNHTHPETGDSMGDYWVEVHAENDNEARTIVISKFGLKWSIQYDPETFEQRWFPKGCYEILKKEFEVVLNKMPFKCVPCSKIHPVVIFTCQECYQEVGKALGYKEGNLSKHLCMTCYSKLEEKAWRYDQLDK